MGHCVYHKTLVNSNDAQSSLHASQNDGVSAIYMSPKMLTSSENSQFGIVRANWDTFWSFNEANKGLILSQFARNWDMSGDGSAFVLPDKM